MKKIIVISLFILFGALAFGATYIFPTILPTPVGVKTYDNIWYVSGPPGENTIDDMRSLGVKLMIDLREPGEIQDNIPLLAKKYQMKYISAPITRNGPLRSDEIEAVEAFIRQSHFNEAWVFCASGNRAAAWLAVHLARSKNLSADEAIQMARERGLDNEQMVQKVREFLAMDKNKSIERHR